MKINVSDGMFTSVDNNGAKTRATDSGTGTTFVKGDAVGIFVVKSDGNLALTNAKYTYDGTSKWLNSNSTEYLPYCEGAKYFAYYPYQESLASSKYDATQTTAETFFGTLISSWTPAADQSTQAKYTAQDLMVSMATVYIPTLSCTFAMSHQMAFVEMDLPQYHYTYNGADTYRFTFDAVKPFKVADGTYRLLVNPSKTFSITGKNQYNSTATMTKGWKISGDAPASSKYKIYKYKGAAASLTQTSRQNVYIGTANVGDYLYSDGTTGTTKAGKTIVGIVFSNEISTAEYSKGYTHGYALALQDVSTSEIAYKAEKSDAGLTKVQTFSAYYNDINAGYYGTFTLHYDKSNATYPAWQAANNYNVNVSGFTNSGWYLPSMGQWWDVCANLDKVDLTSKQIGTTNSGKIYTGSTATTNVKNAIKAAGGTALNTNNYYWSASEYNSNNAVRVNFNSSSVKVSRNGKTGTGYVRAVLAF
jgi:uncharacterized protein (TIGR02145 family)